LVAYGGNNSEESFACGETLLTPLAL
jgi:hypothetical protein